MNLKLLAIGKTDSSALQELITDYTNRLGHYINFELEVLPDIKNTKNLSQDQQKQREGEALLKRLAPQDYVILLDERGKSYSSMEFSQYLQKILNTGTKQLVLIIGGPYGFAQELYQRAQGKLSLSKMTFSHQMVRLFAVEQFYRAFTILRNENYHHE